jgi:hypothetical protein
MADSSRHIPSYRHYKPKNLAVVRISGNDHYLGKYDSPESHEKYDRLIAEWLGNGRLPTPDPTRSGAKETKVSVNEIILAYWQFAKHHYAGDGKPTKELACMRDALRPVRQLYGHTPASEFGPKALKTVRRHMIQSGLSRGMVNHRVSRIKRTFKWAVAEELIPPSVFHGLQAVAGLRFGQRRQLSQTPSGPGVASSAS